MGIVGYETGARNIATCLVNDKLVLIVQVGAYSVESISVSSVVNTKYQADTFAGYGKERCVNVWVIGYQVFCCFGIGYIVNVDGYES